MTPKALTGVLEKMIDQQALWAAGDIADPPPTLLVQGSPGIGKSSIPRQIAARHEMGLVVVDAIQRDAIDLGGLPDIERGDGRSRTVRSVPDIVTELEKLGRPSILLFDDFCSGGRSTMAACASALLDRSMGGAAIPRDCYVMATGNLSTDRVVFHDMPTNIRSRMTRVEMVASIDDWCDWAIAGGLDQRLVASVREEGYSYRDEKWVNMKDPDKAFCVPRTLEFANRYLSYGLGEVETEELIQGAVGTVPGTHLWARIKLITDLPTVEEVVKDWEKAKLPADAGSKYTIARSLTLHLEQKTGKAILAYLQRLGKEYLVFGLKFRLGMEKQNPERFAVRLGELKALMELAGSQPELAKELMGVD